VNKNDPLSNSKSILIVEDEVLIAERLAAILKSLGYAVFAMAHSYDQALHICYSTASIDLVILDIDLNSEKNGIDLSRKIKEECGLPFIFLTSSTESDTLNEAQKQLPYAYLSKPFHEFEINAALQITFALIDQYHTPDNKNKSLIERLTKTEKQVLLKISEGLTTKEIATTYELSPSTIKNHRHNITKKLELSAGSHSLLNWVIQNRNLIIG